MEDCDSLQIFSRFIEQIHHFNPQRPPQYHLLSLVKSMFSTQKNYVFIQGKIIYLIFNKPCKAWNYGAGGGEREVINFATTLTFNDNDNQYKQP